MAGTAQKLTTKQRLWVEEYVKCWNATEAARLAGYSESSCRQIGSENLSKPYIQDAIEKRIEAVKVGADEVLLRLGQMARGDHKHFWRMKHGSPRIDLEAMMKAGMMHLVKKVKLDVETGAVTEVEFYDALAANSTLAKHHKLLTEKIEGTGLGAPVVNFSINGSPVAPETGASLPDES